MKATAKRAVKRAMRDRVYTIRRGVAKGLRRQGGLDFLSERIRPPSREQAFLASLELEGQTVYDIGAFEGVLTMFFARAVGPDGTVIVFEPNPRNVERIRRNVSLNAFGNVAVRGAAVGAARGTARLSFPEDDTGRGSLVWAPKARDPSVVRELDVDVVAIDEEAGSIPPPDFVKIDVEGSELDVLQGMRQTLERCRPRLLIEVHGRGEEAKLRNVSSLLGILEPWYSVRHVESGEPIDHRNPERAILGHLYCERRT